MAFSETTIHNLRGLKTAFDILDQDRNGTIAILDLLRSRIVSKAEASKFASYMDGGDLADTRVSFSSFYDWKNPRKPPTLKAAVLAAMAVHELAEFSSKAS